MDFFWMRAEERIKKAQRECEFEGLPGYGKPFPNDDLASVPESLRMAYRVVKNAGYINKHLL
ncbi:hypothetical protein J2S17_003430 [Cytobacillus purgationiresistens]|uniref:DnaJ homologue subfamily C member 28 conserved domain-containing protein n=1 Tax=Cytobacillus purgationiresistens TaxID=863449 RepID=A0ABU0AJU9_9BACI|nr:hypothetical protein [Cytobacillus purgationiresistens]